MSYSPIKTYPFLRPLAWLYRLAVVTRNMMFDKGIMLSRTFPLPTICVGNLTVGGTGKTPHTEYLIRLLGEEFRVAVLSRGYKRKSKGFVLANSETSVTAIGDEPYQMAHKFPQIYMAVDRDRCHGIEQLTDGTTAPGTEVVLLDDAFQHRYVKAGLNILLTDYHRPIFKDRMLPEGRLREPVGGKERAQIIIVSKCPPAMTQAEQDEWRKDLNLNASQQLFFTTLTYGRLRALFQADIERDLSEIDCDEHALLVTGIASPAPIIETLGRHCSVSSVEFPDHHAFDEADLRQIEQAFLKLPADKRFLVTTEKDAVRLQSLSSLVSEAVKPYIYVLPVAVSFLNQQESFNNKIKEYVRENTRNSSLPEG